MDYTIRSIPQLGTALKSLRISAGLTQKEVANKVGLLQKTVSSIETGTAQSSIESIVKLVSALEYDIVLVPHDKNITDRKLDW